MALAFLRRSENRIAFPVSRRPSWLLSIFLSLVTLSLVADAQQTPDLTEMSLEDLLKVEVTTTVGKRTQKLSRTAAAVYVISREEIERSGLTSVPEILRLAPGVEVAQVNSSTWAIAIRGFNGTLSNKLLVLVDGRTVFSSLFTQVFWAIQDLPLDEIERIEVVRGPGAAIWGANAVNGVINIVTRNSRDTQGNKLALQSGNHDQAVADVRHGGRLNDDATFRISSRFALRGQMDAPGDGGLHDRWDLERFKVRGDWDRSPSDTFNLNGELYNAGAGETVTLPNLDPPSVTVVNTPTTYSGGNALFRWAHKTASNIETVGQVYFDRSHQERKFSGTTDNTLDLDFHQEAHLGPHDLLWGLGLRYIRENTSPMFQISFDPSDQTIALFSGFVQDEITLAPDRLWLTVGTKLEHNPYTGVEAQPDLRLLWAPTLHQSVWAAASRAVRTPAGFEQRGRANVAAFPGAGGVTSLVAVFGSPDTRTETVLAYEAGYRLQAGPKFSFDITGFVDLYHHLESGVHGQSFLEASPAPVHLVLPVVLNNRASGQGEGSEVLAKYKVVSRWELSGSWSWLTLAQQPNAPPAEAVVKFDPHTNPRHQFQAHSYLSLPHHIQFDISAYFVSHLSFPPVPAYTRLDVHLGWSPVSSLQLSAGLQNLLQPHHAEFVETVLDAVPEEVPRSFYGKMEWKF